jgi:hypothetical protein
MVEFYAYLGVGPSTRTCHPKGIDFMLQRAITMVSGMTWAQSWTSESRPPGLKRTGSEFSASCPVSSSYGLSTGCAYGRFRERSAPASILAWKRASASVHGSRGTFTTRCCKVFTGCCSAFKRFLTCSQTVQPKPNRDSRALSIRLLKRSLRGGMPYRSCGHPLSWPNDLAVAIGALGQELAADETTEDSAVFRVAVEGTPRNLHFVPNRCHTLIESSQNS